MWPPEDILHGLRHDGFYGRKGQGPLLMPEMRISGYSGVPNESGIQEINTPGTARPKVFKCPKCKAEIFRHHGAQIA